MKRRARVYETAYVGLGEYLSYRVYQCIQCGGWDANVTEECEWCVYPGL